MIHLALSLIALCVVAYCACLLSVAVGWVVLAALAVVAQLVLAPFEIVSEFVGHWRKRLCSKS